MSSYTFEYEILVDPKLSGLKEIVKRGIRVGYRPLGGICWDGKVYIQVMILEVNEP